MQVAPVVELKRLPPAPDYLTQDQKDLWVMLVKTTVGDMIDPEAYPLLVEYCRAVTASNTIADQIDSFDSGWLADDDGLKRWDRLQAMQGRNAAILIRLSEKLRISPSTRVQAITAARKASGGGQKRKPWQIEQEAT